MLNVIKCSLFVDMHLLIALVVLTTLIYFGLAYKLT